MSAQQPWEPLWESRLPRQERERRDRLSGGLLGVPDSVYVNSEYQVFVTHMDQEGAAGAVHLSIKRNDRTPVQDWRDKQAIKNEVCGPEREAVELYPAESRLVDQADQAHLWVFPEGVTLPLGFAESEVKDDAERRAHLAAALGPEVAATKGSQRNWREGIPTGKGTA